MTEVWRINERDSKSRITYNVQIVLFISVPNAQQIYPSLYLLRLSWLHPLDSHHWKPLAPHATRRHYAGNKRYKSSGVHLRMRFQIDQTWIGPLKTDDEDLKVCQGVAQRNSRRFRLWMDDIDTLFFLEKFTFWSSCYYSRKRRDLHQR